MSASGVLFQHGPDTRRDPVDTIVVTGGAGVASIDAAEVRLAAARIAAMAELLRKAAGISGAAWADVAGGDYGFEAGWWYGAGACLEAGVVRRIASETIAAVTSGLRHDADACDLLGWRLLRAAGLYEESEGLVERVVGGLVTAEGYVLGTIAGSTPVVRLLGAAYRAMGHTASGDTSPRALAPGSLLRSGTAPDALAGRRSPDHPQGTRGQGTGEPGGGGWTAGGFGGAVVRGIAPWTDELAYGFAHGLARSGGERPGVPGAAGVLADAVRAAPGRPLGRYARVERVDAAEFTAGPPAWRDRGPETLGKALARVDDLYPRRGAPEATVAVQRLVGPGEATRWMVFVPGTQSAPPAAHPWDGLTDLELVAGHPDQATQAVEAAMADAGVGPREPVVLVGHSLGGIVVTAFASSPDVTARYRIGGVVTAGAPVATFHTPPGVPVLHLETAEEVVSSTDGGSSTENPRTPDRVTVGRSLADSSAAVDRAASGEMSAAHSIRTHARTLDLARESGDVRVVTVADRIESLLRAERAETVFYRAERVTGTDLSRGASTGPAGSP